MLIDILEECFQKYVNKDSNIDELINRAEKEGFDKLTSEEIKKIKTVLINDIVYTGVSFSIEVDVESNTVLGKLSTESYVDEINSIENDRYKLDNIVVTKLYIGSDEDIIVYDFVAPMDKLEIKY